MKKRLLLICVLILSFALVLVGCSNGSGDTEDGYSEIGAKQKKEYENKLNALEEVLGTKSLLTVATVTTEDDETGEITVTTLTRTVDCTDPDNPKAIESISIRYETENGVCVFGLTAYEQEDEDETTPVDIHAYAPGKEDYTFRGKVDDLTLYFFPNAAGGIHWGRAVWDLLDALDETDGDSGIKVYVDGNKMKATFDTSEDWGTKKGEIEAVLDADAFEYRIFLTTRYESFGETMIEEATISASNETVTIPTAGYDELISAEDFSAVMADYLGD